MHGRQEVQNDGLLELTIRCCRQAAAAATGSLARLPHFPLVPIVYRTNVLSTMMYISSAEPTVPISIGHGIPTRRKRSGGW